jgi:aminoglycoside/choline kinase family phosphotransferase
LEYGIEDRFGISIPKNEKEEMQYWASRLVDSITDITYGFTHRDFQSRNLMLFGYQFFIIDFQDALLGPPQYDLVALLRDSYVELPTQTMEGLINYYLAQREKRKLNPMDPGGFRRHFFEITLQRKLKDAGRFQFIKTVKKNPNFLTHVPTSLKYVRDAFSRLPEYQPLQQLIAEFVPELQ